MLLLAGFVNRTLQSYRMTLARKEMIIDQQRDENSDISFARIADIEGLIELQDVDASLAQEPQVAPLSELPD
jgi:hypothetical protein